jgi:hypothetical protein
VKLTPWLNLIKLLGAYLEALLNQVYGVKRLNKRLQVLKDLAQDLILKT